MVEMLATKMAGSMVEKSGKFRKYVQLQDFGSPQSTPRFYEYYCFYWSSQHANPRENKYTLMLPLDCEYYQHNLLHFLFPCQQIHEGFLNDSL